LEQCGEWKDQGWEWKLEWRREWFDLKIPMVCGIVHQCLPKRELQDEWVWRGKHGGHYMVKDAYNKINAIDKGKATRFSVNYEK